MRRNAPGQWYRRPGRPRLHARRTARRDRHHRRADRHPAAGAATAPGGRPQRHAVHVQPPQLGKAFVMYNNDNKGYIIPSYTMTGVDRRRRPCRWRAGRRSSTATTTSRASAGERRLVFVCPEMLDIEGMAGGQTGTDPGKPKGWMDWPNLRLGTANVPTTIPDAGSTRSSASATGSTPTTRSAPRRSSTPDMFYTGPSATARAPTGCS